MIPRSILELVKNHGGFICGGAMTSIFSDQPIKDYDCYFPNETASQGFCRVLQGAEYSNTFTSKNALTFYGGKNTVQVIIKPGLFQDNVKDIVDQFDFTVCQAGIDPKTETFYCAPDFFPDLAARRLNYNVKAKYPLASLWRSRKYQKKGFTIRASELVKLALRLGEFNLKDIDTLKDQLEGVDSSYLRPFLGYLDGQLTEENRQIDLDNVYSYLSDYLDREHDE